MIRTRFEGLRFFDDKIQYNCGVFFLTEYHVRFDDVIFMESTRYPALEKGTLYVEVAGEVIYQTQQGTHSVSCAFRVPYLPEVQAVHAAADAILAGSDTAVLTEDITTYAGEQREAYATDKANVLQVIATFSMTLTLIAVGLLLYLFVLVVQRYNPFKCPLLLRRSVYTSRLCGSRCHAKTIIYRIDDQKVIRERVSSLNACDSL